MKISTENINVKIGKKEIIKNISADVNAGEFVGIIGPNGSGKSTFLKSIYRVIKPNSGIVTLDDQNIDDMTLKETAKKLGVMTQMNNFSFDFTVNEIVMMGRTPHKALLDRDTKEDFEIVNNAIKKVGMEDFQERKFNTLSGGEKQRVIIARAIASEPKALILDEPTNHLDIHYQISLLEIVKSLGIEVFSAMHDINLTAKYCDKVYVLKDGQVYDYGKTTDIITPQMLKEVFNVNASVERHEASGTLNIIYKGI